MAEADEEKSDKPTVSLDEEDRSLGHIDVNGCTVDIRTTKPGYDGNRAREGRAAAHVTPLFLMSPQ